MIAQTHPYPFPIGHLPARFRTSEAAAVMSSSTVNLPSIAGSNPGTRAASLAFHRHASPGGLRVVGIRLAMLTLPSPSSIRVKAAIYRADPGNLLPDEPLDPQLVSADVPFSSIASTSGGAYLDIPFPSVVAIPDVRTLWVALMCESFYTASDTTNGQLRGTNLRAAVSGPVGTQFDRDLTYTGAGVSTIASPFPTAIAAAANFALAADGSLGNASCGLLCVA